MGFHGIVRIAAPVLLIAGLCGAAESGSAEAFAAQAQNEFRAGAYKKAAKLWQRAVRLDSRNADYRDGLGKAYQREAESSSFPLALTAKARSSFVRALELAPDHAGALADLIDLHQQPIGLCEGNLSEASMLIGRLDQVDPAAAKQKKEYFDDARREASRPGQISLCGPIKVSRVVTNRVFRSQKLRLHESERPQDAIVADKDSASVIAGTK